MVQEDIHDQIQVPSCSKEIDELYYFKKLNFSQLLLLDNRDFEQDGEEDEDECKESSSNVEQNDPQNTTTSLLHPIRLPSRSDQRIILKLKRKSNCDDSSSPLEIKRLIKLEKMRACIKREEKELQRKRKKELNDNPIEVQMKKHTKLVREFAKFKNWTLGNPPDTIKCKLQNNKI